LFGGAELSHRAQSIVKSAFAASCFVFVDYAFVDGRIDDGNSGFKRGLSLLFIACSNSGDHFLDESAKVAALSGIANTAFLCLTRSFFSLW